VEWGEYKELTSQYNTYPENIMFEALTLGLAEEILEMVSAKTMEDRVKELGDTLWYLAELENLSLDSISFQYRRISTFRETMDFIEISKKLISVIKKGVYRRDYSLLQAKTNVKHIMTDLMFELKQHNKEFGVAMISNLRKLQDRKRRGVIQGEGDYR
jgi:hypothetical protein